MQKVKKGSKTKVASPKPSAKSAETISVVESQLAATELPTEESIAKE